MDFVTPIWRPNVPESIDGMPLATTVAELFHNFNYDRLPSNKTVALLMRTEVVVLLLIFYIFSDTPVAKFRDAIGLNPKSTTLRNLIALHNLGLAIFSGLCAWNSWRIVVEHAMDHGFMAIYCSDGNGEFWNSGMGAWSTIFYFSKYYEFIDTWILVLKGKEASFLQVYHHTGIALIMWAAVASQSAWLLFVVLLNSVIHTVMYTYFFIKTVSPKTEIKAARYLTMAQITQFLLGISCTLRILIMGSECDTQSSRFALAGLQLYGYGLIALFVNFAKRKYKKN
mmetsp:Transcript_13003/g.17886  ORF Transcript_13003/g.17886 Transcript_13003/m.17886 type:complete len:283 (-) Transcript_13003:77-925(-)